MDKQILNAIKKGIPISTISKLTGVPETTLRWRMRNIKEYQHARAYYKTWVVSLFES